MKNVHVHIPYPILLGRFDEIAEARLNPEVFLDAESLDILSIADVRSVKDKLDHAGLMTTMHGPFLDLNPGAIDSRVRGVTVDRYLQLFQVADILRPKIIVLHHSYDMWRYDGDVELWLKQSLKTWPQFVERVERIGAVIAVENVFEESPIYLKTLVESIDSPNFKVCFDVGHWHIFSKQSIEEWFKAIGEHVVELHLHDNTGEGDEHMAIGDGKIDFPLLFNIIDRYKRDLVYTIEAHSEDVLWKSLKKLDTYVKRTGVI